MLMPINKDTTVSMGCSATMTKIIVMISVIAATFGAKLPSSLTKCARNDKFNECLLKAIENGIHTLASGPQKDPLTSLNPLRIHAITIAPGSGAVAFSQNFTDFKLTNFDKTICGKALFDFDKNVLDMECTVPLLDMAFHYKINGKILLLPIFGDGPGIMNLENLKIHLKMNFEQVEKDGKKYYKLSSFDCDLDTTRIVFKLENLFNGDKLLSENILQVMNDNWSDMFADVRDSYGKAFGQVFASIFERILAKVPIDEVFGKK